MSEKGCRKDKNQNIQVFVRLRPLNQCELDIRSQAVVEVVNGREVVVVQSQPTSHTKRYTFDGAFPSTAKQVEVYQHVVSPLIDEVFNGYKCTVFAYGQTGSGKTHTMLGESSGNETIWQSDPLAGIIPRAVSQLFDELFGQLFRITNTEYRVRVSYLELYNEELFDLLSTSEDNSKLRIYEDVIRKQSNIVNGLKEITVFNKTEVYRIMAQGQKRRRVASTLMNAQSSRSHTVFTIVMHIKEKSPEGEELVKIGTLNLAGSENISKAGSDNPAKRKRARECVNNNQSLLTLGRVITALVERHQHIPYRESKLTRILQESLDGRTKTSIIATISPGHKDLEETMSTLEYVCRAKRAMEKEPYRMENIFAELNQKLEEKESQPHTTVNKLNSTQTSPTNTSYLNIYLTIMSNLPSLRSVGQFSAFQKSCEDYMAARALTLQRQNRVLRDVLQRQQAEVRAWIQSITQDAQIYSVEVEKKLDEWIEDELKRIMKHMYSERELLEDGLKRRIYKIEAQRAMFEEITNKQLEWLNSLLKELEKNSEVAIDLNQIIKEAKDDMQKANKLVEECEKRSNTLSEKALEVTNLRRQ